MALVYLCFSVLCSVLFDEIEVDESLVYRPRDRLELEHQCTFLE